MKGIIRIKSMPVEQALAGRLRRALASHHRANGVHHRARAARQVQWLLFTLRELGIQAKRRTERGA